VTEQNCISESVWRVYGGGREKMLEDLKYWNNPSIYEYNIMHRTVSCWILMMHGEREWVSNGGEGLI
jgi:hypothetical protein